MSSPVFRDKYVRAWPKYDAGVAPEYLPLPELLRRTYATDAHFAAYRVPSVPRRLDVGAPVLLAERGGVVMAYAVFDIDAPKTQPRDERAAWCTSTLAALERLELAHPGGFVYATKNGYRVVYRLPEPHVIRSSDDARAWRAQHARWVCYLARAFGVIVDAGCGDWTRLYRAPHTTRDGVPQALPTWGDPDAMGVWSYVPTNTAEDDYALALELHASKAPQWSHAVNALKTLLPVEPKAPKAAAATKTRKAPQRPEIPYDASLELELAAELASCGFAHGFLDRVACLLGGTLGAYGFSAERVGAIVGHAAAIAGFTANADSMAEKAERKATRVRTDVPTPQGGQLRKFFPEHAAVVARYAPLRNAPPVANEAAPPAAPLLLSAREAFSSVAAAVASALDKPSSITVIATTPGAGKSHAVRAALAQRTDPGVMFVPTHALGDAYVLELLAAGATADAPRGVTAKLDTAGDTVCKLAERAEHIAILGAPPREVLCRTCPHADNYDNTGTPCAAREGGADGKPRLRVLQNSIAPRALWGMEKRVRETTVDGDSSSAEGEEKAPPPRIFVMDEPPPLTASFVMDGLELERNTRAVWNKEKWSMRDEVREAIDPLSTAVQRAYATGAVRSGMTLREVAVAGAGGINIDDAIACAKAAPPTQVKTSDIHSIARADVDDASRERELRLVHATLYANALAEAAHHPDAPLVAIDEHGTVTMTHRASWCRAARAISEAGGCVLILDATADAEAISAALGTVVTFVRVDAADAPGVERASVSWASAARSRHVAAPRNGAKNGAPKPREMRGVLHNLAARIQERGARHVGALTDKPTAIALTAALELVRTCMDAPVPELIPDELAELVRGGVRFDVGHYGAQRGLDRWAECDVVCTLGDPWPNVLAAQAEAATLGLEPGAYLQRQLAAELTQAWGRARPVHRTTPVLILSYSLVGPDLGLAPQWRDVPTAALRVGRPPSAHHDPSTWAAEREAKGISKRAHATVLGIPWGTYQRLDRLGAEGSPGWSISPSKNKSAAAAADTHEASRRVLVPSRNNGNGLLVHPDPTPHGPPSPLPHPAVGQGAARAGDPLRRGERRLEHSPLRRAVPDPDPDPLEARAVGFP